MDELSPERFYDFSIATGATVSPDGERVAFLVSEFDAEDDDRHTSLFVAPTDGSAEPYRLTRASSASSPQWSPDGDRLGFLAARETDAGVAVENGAEEDADEEEEEEEENGGPVGEGPKPQVWSFDMERGGDARQLTDRDYGVAEFDWAPDGERLVIAARDPTEEDEEYLQQRNENGPIEIDRLQHKGDGAGWMDEVSSYLFVVDADSRETVRLDNAYDDEEKGDRRGLQPAWSPDGDRIAFVAQHEEDPDDTHVRNVYTIRPDGTGYQQLTDAGLRVQQPRWSPDGSRIAVGGGDPYNWYKPTEAYVIDGESGEMQSVSGSLDRTIAFGGNPHWLDDDTLVGLFGDEGNTRMIRLDAEEDDPERVFVAQGRSRSVSGLSVSDDGSTLAFRMADPTAGADIYAMGREGLDAEKGAEADAAGLARVSEVNADLVDEHHDCVRVSWENSDGVTIHGLAYLPPEFDPEDPEPHPVVSSVHGGPMSYDSPAFGFDQLFWTSKDYIVLRTNYRGSTSYGQEFAERLRGTRGDKEVDDVVTGVEHLVEEGWADEDRLYLTGFSYGGVTTAATVTKSDTFAAAAAEHGIYDFYATFGTDDNHLWHEDEFGLPWENVDTYREISSITDVGGVDTPLLVTAGENDWRCPPTQAEQLFVSVRKQGVDARLVIYPDEHHNIGDPDRAIHRLEELESWFAEH
ncbi:S9 family peptidase [Halolamina salina]|uniref:S9 family peptidase n=1 Tax=Halolamina salina TaxID=1220023 RepID=UPI00360916D3